MVLFFSLLCKSMLVLVEKPFYYKSATFPDLSKIQLYSQQTSISIKSGCCCALVFLKEHCKIPLQIKECHNNSLQMFYYTARLKEEPLHPVVSHTFEEF